VDAETIASSIDQARATPEHLADVAPFSDGLKLR
jgi:hypothetical protein